MPIIRRATVADAALITQHRHSMFADNGFASEDRLVAMDQSFEPWVAAKLTEGTYVGLLAEEDDLVMAGAGIFFGEFAPHFLHLEPMRPYLLNFYTAPAARGQGLAKLLLTAAVEECRRRHAKAIVLHASPFGRPIYEQFGFQDNNEMILKLE